MSAIEIVGGEQLERLADLQGIAEAVFGLGQRSPGWFARKLARQCVEPGLSAIAREHGQICGYALLGRPPSLDGRARGAGVGVLEAARGRGIGRALIELALERACTAGCTAIEFLAEPAHVDWYTARDFVIVEGQLSVAADGLGVTETIGELPADAPSGYDDDDGGEPPADRSGSARANRRVPWSWLPEAWQRTPAAERAFVQLDVPVPASAWLTREGRAWLIHRLELDDPEHDALVEVLMALRRRARTGTPLLAYPCPAHGPTPAACARAGFEVLQRSFVVRRACRPSSV